MIETAALAKLCGDAVARRNPWVVLFLARETVGKWVLLDHNGGPRGRVLWFEPEDNTACAEFSAASVLAYLAAHPQLGQIRNAREPGQWVPTMRLGSPGLSPIFRRPKKDRAA